jgi:hypothetical protein
MAVQAIREDRTNSTGAMVKGGNALAILKSKHSRTAIRDEIRGIHAACRSTSQPLQANSTVRGIGCLPLA